jgi:L-threonylcarbamoyladenylate synthase
LPAVPSPPYEIIAISLADLASLPQSGAHDWQDGGVTFRVFDCTSDDPEQRAAAVDEAGAAIERGECIVLPTDTVYGIGADAFDADAVQRLLDAKGRGREMPPPVLIGDSSLIRALATEVPEPANDLIARYWPGPLTIICRMQPSLRMDLGDTEGTIALRVPDHALTRDILRRTGPLAVSSANLSGRPAAVTCQQAVDQLGESVAIYIDAGPSGGTGSAPSTIVDFTRHECGEVLRRGALSPNVLRETLPDLLDSTFVVENESGPEPAEHSGSEPPASQRHHGGDEA